MILPLYRDFIIFSNQFVFYFKSPLHVNIENLIMRSTSCQQSVTTEIYQMNAKITILLIISYVN